MPLWTQNWINNQIKIITKSAYYHHKDINRTKSFWSKPKPPERDFIFC